MKNFFLIGMLFFAADALAQYYPWGYLTWKQPVVTFALLPASGNILGDVRVETDNTSVYEWNGSAWTVLIPAGGASGTVGSVSVVTTNGFSGTVANPTTNPAITLATTVTGLLQGNGTAVSAATTGNLSDVGTDGIVVGNGTGAVIGTGTSLAQHVADTSHNGYLASADWNTFNGKQPAITTSNLSDAGTDGITISGGLGAVIGTGTTVAQHVADTTHNGYLASADWNTFNGKQVSGNYITALTGGVTASGPGSATATVVTNANLTGPITSSGNATAIAAQVGTGTTFVMNTAPTISNLTTTGILKGATAFLSGNVGVGTTAVPSVQLQVGTGIGLQVNSAGSITTMTGDVSATLAANALALHVGGGTANVSNSSATAGAALMVTGSAATAGILQLRTTSASGSGDFIDLLGGNAGATNIARFNGTGNVGIGTTVPIQEVDISSAANTSARISSTNTGVPAERIYFEDTAQSTVSNWLIGANQINNNEYDFIPSTTAGGTTYSTSTLALKSSGVVVIGATSSNQHVLNTATAASSNCGTLLGGTACIQISINGTTRYIPYY